MGKKGRGVGGLILREGERKGRGEACPTNKKSFPGPWLNLSVR